MSRHSLCSPHSCGKFARGTGSILYAGPFADDEEGEGTPATPTTPPSADQFQLELPEEHSFDALWAEGLDWDHHVRYLPLGDGDSAPDGVSSHGNDNYHCDNDNDCCGQRRRRKRSGKGIGRQREGRDDDKGGNVDDDIVIVLRVSLPGGDPRIHPFL